MKISIWLVITLFITATTAQAAFINGGFETGDTTGWTQDGGSYYGGEANGPNGESGYVYTGDPGLSAIVGQGTDPISGLPTVYNGTYAARVNNYPNGYPFSTFSQTVVWTDPKINFDWMAVLEEPSNYHPPIDEPQFTVILHDNTTNIDLYNVAFSTIQMQQQYPLLVGISNADPNSTDSQWYYTPWMNITLDTSAVTGDSLTLTVIGSACGWGGHGGYAYVDAIDFLTLPPNPGVTPAFPITPEGPVPVPATFLLLGSGLLGLAGFRKKIK